MDTTKLNTKTLLVCVSIIYACTAWCTSTNTLAQKSLMARESALINAETESAPREEEVQTILTGETARANAAVQEADTILGEKGMDDYEPTYHDEEDVSPESMMAVLDSFETSMNERIPSVKAIPSSPSQNGLSSLNESIISSISTNVVDSPTVSYTPEGKDYMAEPGSEFESNLFMTLRECITIGLKNNLGLAVEEYNPPIQWEEIRRARSVFDPVLYGQGAWTGQNSPAPYRKYFITGDSKLVVGNRETKQKNFEGRISGKFITGLQYTLESGLTETRNEPEGSGFNPTMDVYTRASLVVPLLKNFGIGVNMAPIRIARNNWRISRVQLEAAVEQLVTDITESYWNLYYVREDANATEYTLQLANELLQINEAKVRVGMAAPLDVTQAKARIATEEGQLLLARNAVRNAEDRLRQIINYKMDELLRPRAYRPIEIRIVPLEKPQVVEFDFREDTLIEIALKNRQDLEVQRLQLMNARQNMKVARNELLPEVNFLASLGYTGTGESFDNAYDDQYTTRHPDWALGMELSMPLFYNEPVANYRVAKYSQRQQEITIEQVKYLIAVDVRTALRNLQTNRKRIYATQEATKYAREQLYAEQEKFNVGHSTTFDVLDFQEKLADALSQEIQALADWRISVAQLYLTIGRTLEENNIVVDEFYEHPEKDDSFSISEFVWPTGP